MCRLSLFVYFIFGFSICGIFEDSIKSIRVLPIACCHVFLIDWWVFFFCFVQRFFIAMFWPKIMWQGIKYSNWAAFHYQMIKFVGWSNSNHNHEDSGSVEISFHLSFVVSTAHGFRWIKKRKRHETFNLNSFKYILLVWLFRK